MAEKSSVKEAAGDTSRDASLDALPDFLLLRVRSLIFGQVSMFSEWVIPHSKQNSLDMEEKVVESV